MMNQDSELDAFKREIDLREFAVSLGYEIDRRDDRPHDWTNLATKIPF